MTQPGPGGVSRMSAGSGHGFTVAWRWVPEPALGVGPAQKILLESRTRVSWERDDFRGGWCVERSSTDRAMRLFLTGQTVATFDDLMTSEARVVEIDMWSTEEAQALLGHHQESRAWDWTWEPQVIDVTTGVVEQARESVLVRVRGRGIESPDDGFQMADVGMYIEGRERLLSDGPRSGERA